MSDLLSTAVRVSGFVLVLAPLGHAARATTNSSDAAPAADSVSVASLPGPSSPDAARFPRTAPAAGRHDQPLVASSGADSVWVRGATYKAGFSPAGATFVPYFGAQAPANHPVTLRVAGMCIDGEPQAFDAAAAPQLQGTTLDFERGPFVERYECRTEGVEQMFVFPALPARGEIRLSIAFASDLVPSVDGGSFTLACDLGHVSYGRAVAIDADGRRADVTSRITGGAIELVLPAEFVRAASLPLVIDPLIASFPIATTASADFDPDVAYDATTGHWIVTYEEAFSATDHDVWAEVRDRTGAFLAGNYADVSTDYWAHPRVANNGLAQAFLVVAAVGQPTGGARVVRGRIATASNATFGLPFTISGAESGEQINPDVGGDPLLAGPTYFCVVWERAVSPTNHDVLARLVQGDGTLFGPGTILLDTSTTTLDSVPAVSKSNGSAPAATQEWSVVWHRASPFPEYGDVYGAQIHRDGAITHATFPINATEEDVYQPEVSTLLDGATGARNYLVVYSSFDSYFATGFNAVGSVVNGSTVLGTSDIHSQIDPTTIARDQTQPSVDSDGQHFAVTYAQRSPTGTSNDDVLFADVLVAGTSLRVCESGVVASTSNREMNARVASAHGGGGMLQRYMFAWDSTDVAGAGAPDVLGALYDGGLGGCIRPQCFGDGSGIACPCGNTGAPGNGCASSVSAAGANLSWTGNAQVSADTLVLLGTLMPNSSCLYFQGSSVVGGGNGSAFGDGLRCAGGSVIRLGTKTNVGGASQYPVAGDPPVSVRGLIPAIGQVRWYQIWYRNAAAFCTTATFNLSNALQVVWAP